MDIVDLHPQHLRSDLAYQPSRQGVFTSLVVVVLFFSLCFGIISWRLTQPILLDSSSFHANSAAVGSAYSGYSYKTQQNNLGKYSEVDYPAGYLINYIPFDVKQDILLDAEVTLDPHLKEEGLAIFLRPSSVRSQVWKIGKYSGQGFGLAGFNNIVGFKIDLHPTTRDQLKESGCSTMCSPDPQGITSPFGAFIATGSSVDGKPLTEKTGYLQVLDLNASIKPIRNVQSLTSGSPVRLRLKWDAVTEEMIVRFNNQEWSYNFSHLVNAKVSYWLGLASSNSNPGKKYSTSIKVNTVRGAVAPQAVKWLNKISGVF